MRGPDEGMWSVPRVDLNPRISSYRPPFLSFPFLSVAYLFSSLPSISFLISSILIRPFSSSPFSTLPYSLFPRLSFARCNASVSVSGTTSRRRLSGDRGLIRGESVDDVQ